MYIKNVLFWVFLHQSTGTSRHCFLPQHAMVHRRRCPFPPTSSLNGLHKDAAAAVVLMRERPPVAEERNCLSRGAALLELLPL